VEDPNGKTTTASYDPLGRLVGVWLPGRSLAATPNLAYGYTVSDSVPSHTSTTTLNPGGVQVASYQILDGLLRERQTQTPAAQEAGGRVVTDTGYDSRGLVVKTSLLWNATNPSSTLVSFADGDVPRQNRYVHDGAGRVTSEQLWSEGSQLWGSATAYDGDRTLRTPPAGGTATTALLDVAGRLVQLRQHTAAGTPTGAYQATGYTYDNAGRLVGVSDPAGNDWSYTFDPRGRLVQTVDPDRGGTTFAHDDAGQLTSSTDARSTTLAYAHDTLGRTTSVWADAVGTGTKRAEWVYDTVELGQLTSATRIEAGNAYTSTVTGYDDGYRPLGVQIAFPTAEGALSSQGLWTFATTYNVDGSVATPTLPAGGGLPAETLTTSSQRVG
jgi:YD repeat-containing protein